MERDSHFHSLFFPFLETCFAAFIASISIKVNTNGLINADSIDICRYFDPHRNEFFFDRCRVAFESILYYYQSFGKLRRPATVPIDVFLEEVRFYELGDNVIESLKNDEGYGVKEEEKPLPENELFKKIWLLFEDPGSSIGARYVAIISVLVIVASIVIFCIETLPQFKHYKVYLTHDNKTKIIEDDDPSPTDPFFIIECFCIAWFTTEFVLRFISSPSKMEFVKVSVSSSCASSSSSVLGMYVNSLLMSLI